MRRRARAKTPQTGLHVKRRALRVRATGLAGHKARIKPRWISSMSPGSVLVVFLASFVASTTSAGGICSRETMTFPFRTFFAVRIPVRNVRIRSQALTHTDEFSSSFARSSLRIGQRTTGKKGKTKRSPSGRGGEGRGLITLVSAL